MRSWAQSQVRMFRKLGFNQRLGLGLWAKQDFAATVEPKAADEDNKPAAPVVDASPSPLPSKYFANWSMPGAGTATRAFRRSGTNPPSWSFDASRNRVSGILLP